MTGGVIHGCGHTLQYKMRWNLSCKTFLTNNNLLLDMIHVFIFSVQSCSYPVFASKDAVSQIPAFPASDRSALLSDSVLLKDFQHTKRHKFPLDRC
jgi:hypothetical protein